MWLQRKRDALHRVWRRKLFDSTAKRVKTCSRSLQLRHEHPAQFALLLLLLLASHTLQHIYTLQDRISSSANAPINIYGAAGEEVRVQCGISLFENWKIFCRENCEGGNILIKTNQPTGHSGRYRTEYVKEATSAFSLYVSISALTRSDEGRYRCGLGDSSSSGSYQDFRLVVADALLDGNKVPHLHKDAGSSLTVACSFKRSGRKQQFCRGGCGKEEVLLQTDGVTADKSRYYMKYEEQKSRAFLLVTIKQLVQSDSDWYRCKLYGTGSSSSYRDFQVTVRTASTPSTGTSFSSSSGSFTPSLPSETSGLNQENSTSKGSPTHRSADVLRFVVLTLVVIILSSLLLLVCCRKRSEKHT
ncbi:polymeric immunoglobulin receptor-like, partial [Poecilia reticulata]|uniref:polymeric immunoglobulin receptor-like n=1 Tax=Poecilia reticulata TaxID=8081 RepID=UPI0007E965F1